MDSPVLLGGLAGAREEARRPGSNMKGLLLLCCTAVISNAARLHQWPHMRLVERLRGGAREDGPYSFSLTTFSPRGSLSQIEYAMNSAQAGALSAAACYNGGVVVASVCKAGSPLVMELGTRKIARVTDGCCVLYSGLAADSRVLTRKAAETALEYRRKFGENTSVPVGTLVSKIAEVLQDYTQMGGVRPFGVALLVAGIDCIYRVEPSGSFSAWKCVAVGKGSSAAEAMLHEGFKEAMDRNSALELLLSVLQKCSIGTSREDIDTAFVEDSSSK